MGKRRRTKEFHAPGMSMRQVGRFIEIQTYRTSEQQKVFFERAAQMHRELPTIIRKKAEQLEREIQRYESLDLISMFSFHNLFANPETYKEYAHEGRQAYAEYLALLCLKSPYQLGTTVAVSGEDLQRISVLVEEIFQDTFWYYGTEAASARIPSVSPLLAEEEIRFRTILNQLIVRNPGYEHHLTDFLVRLFGTPGLGEAIREVTGFTPNTAIRCMEAIDELMSRKLTERRDKAHDEEKKLKKALVAFRKGQPVPSDIPHDLLARLSKLRRKKAIRLIRRMLTAWIFVGLGDTLSFTPEDLVEVSKTDAPEVRAILDGFSIEFGEIRGKFYMPALTHELQEKPIIRHEGRYLLPIPAMLLWAIRPRLEMLINPDWSSNSTAKLWERYQKLRGELLVSEGIRFFKEALPQAECYQHLKYKLGKQEYELDGLVLFDTYAFLMEAKAGTLSQAARRGAPSLKEDLRDLVGQSHDQSLRAEEFIERNAQPIFTLPDDRVLRFNKKRWQTHFLVSLTLEPLGSLTSVLNRVAQLGIFTSEQLPWAVSLLDLRVIGEMVEFPSQLIHFLTRRLRLNSIGKVVAHDELDWLGHYLHEGLYFEEGPATQSDFFHLASYTTDFDDYYLYETGKRQTPAKKPRQPLPTLARAMLKELESNDGLGYVGIASALLDMSSKSQNRFTKYAERQRERTNRDGEIHDFTLMFEFPYKWGLSYVFANRMTPQRLHQRLSSYCILKKHQMKYDKWIGLGCLADRPGWIHAWLRLDQPWREDPEMDRLAKERLPGKKPIIIKKERI